MSPRALSFLPALLAAGLLGCGPTTSPSKQINGKPESTGSSSGAGSTGVALSSSSSSSSASSSSSSSASSSSAASSSASSSASSAGSTGGHSSSASSSTGTTGDDPTPDLGPSTPICTVLESTTDVNLREGPGTSFHVIVVVPEGSQVTTINSEQSQNGFYNVSYQGIQGFTYADYYRVVSVGTGAGCGTTSTTSTSSSSSSSSGSSTGGHGSTSTGGHGSTSTGGSTGTQTARDVGIQKAQEAMGFSYYWGHGRFLTTGPTSSTVGSCTGNCPSCTHSGSYGGDCSGLAGKVWLLGNPDMTVDSHPYSTYDFVHSTHGWHSTTRDTLIRGDAMTYNTNGAGHIFIYESGDGWGDMWAYECKGCAAGCVHDLRSAGSAYLPIARDGW